MAASADDHHIALERLTALNRHRYLILHCRLCPNTLSGPQHLRVPAFVILSSGWQLP
jgi:hypothetical protein